MALTASRKRLCPADSPTIYPEYFADEDWELP
jgi:hypothetical protein